MLIPAAVLFLLGVTSSTSLGLDTWMAKGFAKKAAFCDHYGGLLEKISTFDFSALELIKFTKTVTELEPNFNVTYRAEGSLFTFLDSKNGRSLFFNGIATIVVAKTPHRVFITLCDTVSLGTCSSEAFKFQNSLIENGY